MHCFFSGVLKHVGVLKNSRGVGVVKPHINLEVDNIEHVETSTVLLGVVKIFTGRDTNIEGYSMLELENPGVLNDDSDEVVSTAHNSGMYVELGQLSCIFESSLSADWGCSVGCDVWVNWGAHRIG